MRSTSAGRWNESSRNRSSAKRHLPANILRRASWAAMPVLAAAFWASPAYSQTLTWDSSGSGTPTDGLGNWDTTTSANWFSGAGPDSTWTNGDAAVFGVGGTPGTVTIDDASGSVNAVGLTFNASTGDYTIAASGSDSLTLSGAATISVAAGQSPTISAPIAGAAGLTLSGPGNLNLTGANTFTGPVNINSGSLTVGTGGNLGATANAVNLGTPQVGTSSNNPVGSLAIAPSISVTIGSLVCATNNVTGTNSLTIGSGATLNVNSSIPATGANSLANTNGVFIVGSSNLASGGPVTTSLTISGAGTLSVDGTTGGNNSSFLVGIGNSNTSTNVMIPKLDMSSLANFTFITGLGPIPNGGSTGGNEFDVGVGGGANATALLAVNSTITAGTIDIGDDAINTPGLTGNGPNNSSNNNTLDLGSGTNAINTNTLLIGIGREVGSMTWLSTVTTGTLALNGGAGSGSNVNITVGTASTGTPPNSASSMNLTGHAVNVQAGTVTLGVMAGGTGGKATTTTGGSVSFDTGTFTIASALNLATATSGTSLDAIGGTFNVGSGPSSTGSFTLGSAASPGSFHIANYTGSSASSATGIFNVKGGTANVFANIIDVSTAGTSNTTLALTGGTLNMEGYAIGPTSAAGNIAPIGTRHITTITLPSGTATLANLGGTGINDAGVNMNGTGTLILNGNDTYTGPTTITTGTLQVGALTDTAAPSTPFLASGQNITNNSALAFGSSQVVTMAGIINGPGTLNQVGTGTTVITGSNNYGGVTNVTKGVLQIGNGTAIGTLGTNAGTITVNGTLSYDHSDNVSIANPIVGSGVMQQIGSGTATLSGSNTYVGGTNVSNGTLLITTPTALGFGGINTKKPQGTTVNVASTLDLSGQTITQAITLNGGTLTNSSAAAANIGSGVLGVGILTPTGPFTGDAAISFSGPGTGAAATAVLGLSSASFAINAGQGGTGYTGSSANPVITITGGGGTGATATAVASGGSIIGVNITNPGTGYTSAPLITIAAPATGTQAFASGNATNFVLDGIQQTSAGSGYVTAPTATLTATAGSAVLSTTAVSGITLVGNGTIGGTGDINIAGAVTGGGTLSKTDSDTVTLSAPNTYSGGTNVTAGLLLIQPTGATSSALGGGAVNISNTGILRLATNVTLGSQSSPTPASNVNLTSLSISNSGQLDLNNNHIIINYGLGVDPIASIAALVASGYAGGSWNGLGIMSTAAQANGASYGIGYADANDVGNPAGLASGQIEVMYTLLGDANLDGKVNGTDFAILATDFNQAVSGWDGGDFNYDGKANGSDFAFIASNFNQGASQAATEALEAFAAANGLLADVPEPTSTVLFVVTGLGMMARRRRR